MFNNIAVAGTGLMGSALVLRLLEKGMNVAFYNRSDNNCEKLKKAGAVFYSNPVLFPADFRDIILFVSDYRACLDVLAFFKHSGLKGKRIILMSTVSPKQAEELCAVTTDLKGEFCEAPVQGSIAQIKKSSLQVFCGCRPELYSELSPLFRLFCKDIFYTGSCGSGSTVKLAMNNMIGFLYSGFSYSFNLVKKAGINTDLFMDVLRGSSLYAETFDKKLEKIQKDDFTEANFTLKHLLKDMELVRDALDQKDIGSELCNCIANLIKKGVQKDYSELDYSVLFRIIKEQVKEI